MTLEGVSPDDAERLLARPMEQQVRTIEGLKEFRSHTYQGGASVVLEFQAGYDIDKALDDVREQVDLAKPELPEDTDEPFVQEVAFSRFPVLVVTLSGDVPERSLRQLADRLQDKIEGIPAVLEATMSGEREELVELVIDPLQVEAYGLALDEIGTIVSRSNRLVAAGTMDTGQGRFAIKVPGLFESGADILEMPLKVSGDALVQVKDIASLRRTFKDPDSVARIDGLPAIGIEVSKRAGENIIETINEVRALVAAESQAWPPQVKVTFSQDSSKEIRSMLGELENSLITAVLLVLIVIVASLGLRGGLIVGIAVPGSFLIGILMLAGFGLFAPAAVDGIAARVTVLREADAQVALRGASVIFEGVPEVLDLKRDVFARISKLAGPEPIIASTTSTILVDDLSLAVAHPERFLNAHWLNPAFLIPLVEIAPGARTDPAVTQRLRALLEGIGKVPVVCAARPGYIVPRIQALAMNEAARMVEEGVASAEDIDKAIKNGFGFRYANLGLLEFIDYGGGDILYYASRYLAHALGDQRYAAPEIIERNMREGNIGLKTGKGFLDYSQRERLGRQLEAARLERAEYREKIEAAGGTGAGDRAQARDRRRRGKQTLLTRVPATGQALEVGAKTLVAADHVARNVVDVAPARSATSGYLNAVRSR
ncbi:MAG: hypothetical protein HC869_24070 [Rhodospirillales bacterium]|nr:hypothetical protein [Rhodospirillales bacterium]